MCVFKRVVIKLSGEAIGDSNSITTYNDSMIDSMIKQIRQVVQAGTQVSLVIGGGNLWRGVQARPDMDRVKADQMGMLATVMNAIYLAEVFGRFNNIKNDKKIKARVITPIPIGNITTVYDKDSAIEWMENGEVLINAAGLGHPMFSTDSVTALRAAELEADCILFAKNIDGVYNADPKHNPEARKYRKLNYHTAITKSLQAADLAALHLANDAKIPSYVFELDQPESIVNACTKKTINGTYIHVNVEDEFYE